MVKFSNLQEKQQIDFILQLQKQVGKTFRTAFRADIISSREAKDIMDNVLRNNRHLNLQELRRSVLSATHTYINNKSFH